MQYDSDSNNIIARTHEFHQSVIDATIDSLSSSFSENHLNDDLLERLQQIWDKNLRQNQINNLEEANKRQSEMAQQHMSVLYEHANAFKQNDYHNQNPYHNQHVSYQTNIASGYPYAYRQPMYYQQNLYQPQVPPQQQHPYTRPSYNPHNNLQRNNSVISNVPPRFNFTRINGPQMIGTQFSNNQQQTSAPNQPSLLGKRASSTTTSDLGLIPKRSKNNDGGSDSDSDDRDLFHDGPVSPPQETQNQQDVKIPTDQVEEAAPNFNQSSYDRPETVDNHNLNQQLELPKVEELSQPNAVEILLEQEEKQPEEEESDESVEPLDQIFCEYTKIQRTRVKYKCEFKNAILHIKGRDYVLKNLAGDIEY